MIKEFRFKGQSILMYLEPETYASDANLLYYLEANRVPEPEVIHVMLRALKVGDHCIDAGANVGFFTALMSKLVGETGRVLAIEPDSRNLLKLAKNLDINNCRNVTVIGFPVGARGAPVQFLERKENGTSSIHRGKMDADVIGGQFTHTATLTQLIDTYELRPTFMKMDIEGSEVEAMQGCEPYIDVIVAEVNGDALRSADSSIEEFVETMDTYGHAAHAIHYDGGVPSVVRPDQKIRATRQNANMLFTTGAQISKLWPEVEI